MLDKEEILAKIRQSLKQEVQRREQELAQMTPEKATRILRKILHLLIEDGVLIIDDGQEEQIPLLDLVTEWLERLATTTKPVEEQIAQMHEAINYQMELEEAFADLFQQLYGVQVDPHRIR
jgi:hypothetical protein